MVMAVPMADSAMIVPVTRPELYFVDGLKNSCAEREKHSEKKTSDRQYFFNCMPLK
jgi:hypothetical protein